MAILNHQPNGDMQVDFIDPVSGIAPGQSAVFYEGEDLLGGGFIKK
jgi:tRNA-specific 2-thiouridylase